jgi:hypothetical protein
LRIQPDNASTSNPTSHFLILLLSSQGLVHDPE